MADGKCSKCVKPLDGAHQSYCKLVATHVDGYGRLQDQPASWPCGYRRKWTLKSNYGLTVEQYDEMVNDQDGQCAICKCMPDDPLFVDHDHSSGAVRGLLCSNCNFAIGLLADDPERLDTAASYLRHYSLRVVQDKES